MNIDESFVIRVRGVILDKEKLLIVKHAHDASFMALPGGKMEWGEDILKCLEREIFEELGVVPKIGRLIYVNNFIQDSKKQSIEFFFEISNVSDFQDTSRLKGTHAHELAEICWVSTTDTLNILPKGFMEDFKSGSIINDNVRFIYNN